MAWYSAIVVVGSYLLDLFIGWLNTIFVLPLQTTDMLWLLVPVWVAWAFTEFFQEKVGTSMGNAISNSVIILWGSIDCTRQTVSLIMQAQLKSTIEIILRFSIIGAIFCYGFLIVFLGWKGNKVIRHIGRIRIVTYIFAMFVPIFYGAIPLTFEHIISAILFFPLFYFGIELIDRFMPDPRAIKEDNEDSSLKSSSISSPSAFAQFDSQASAYPNRQNTYSNQVINSNPYQNLGNNRLR